MSERMSISKKLKEQESWYQRLQDWLVYVPDGKAVVLQPVGDTFPGYRYEWDKSLVLEAFPVLAQYIIQATQSENEVEIDKNTGRLINLEDAMRALIGLEEEEEEEEGEALSQVQEEKEEPVVVVSTLEEPRRRVQKIEGGIESYTLVEYLEILNKQESEQEDPYLVHIQAQVREVSLPLIEKYEFYQKQGIPWLDLVNLRDYIALEAFGSEEREEGEWRYKLQPFVEAATSVLAERGYQVPSGEEQLVSSSSQTRS